LKIELSWFAYSFVASNLPSCFDAGEADFRDVASAWSRESGGNTRAETRDVKLKTAFQSHMAKISSPSFSAARAVSENKV